MALLHQADNVETADLEFRYQECLALLDNDHAVVIRNVFRDDDNNVRCRISQNLDPDEDNRRSVSMVEAERLDPTYQFGWLNYNNRYAVLVSRGLRRSYQYGIRSDLMNINLANMLFYSGRVNRWLRQPRANSLNVFELMHTSEYRPPGEAASLIRQGRAMNQAINDRMALTMGAHGTPVLAYNHWLVGYLDPRNRVILYTGAEHLSEEIEEILPIESVIEAGQQDNPFSESEGEQEEEEEYDTRDQRQRLRDVMDEIERHQMHVHQQRMEQEHLAREFGRVRTNPAEEVRLRGDDEDRLGHNLFIFHNQENLHG